MNTSKASSFFRKTDLWSSLYKNSFKNRLPKWRIWKILIQRLLCALDGNLSLPRRHLIFPTSDLQKEWQMNNIENARFMTKKQLSALTNVLNIPTPWKLKLLTVVPSQGGWPRELLIWHVRKEERLLRMFSWKSGASVQTALKVKLWIWLIFETNSVNF